MKRSLRTIVFLIACVFVIFVAQLTWNAMFPPQGGAGMAAVSAGISEALVETFALVVIGFLGWQVWRVVRRYWFKRDASR